MSRRADLDDRVGRGLAGLRYAAWLSTLAAAMALACAPQEAGPRLPLLGIDRVEVRFGTGCRPVADVGGVVGYFAALPDDWQSFWKEPPEASFHVTLAQGEAARLRVGLVGGQMILEGADGMLFRQLGAGEADRLMELVGGVPLGGELGPCLLSGQPLEAASS